MVLTLFVIAPLYALSFIQETVIVPPVIVEPVRYSKEHNEQVIKKVFGADANKMIAIARCESGLDNLAVNENDRLLNSHPSKGIFQISEIHGEREDWWKPEVNASIALSLYKKQGVKPWYNCSVKLGLL